jgi:phosphoglycerate kinase
MYMSYLKITDVNLQGKRVLIREDFNVPLEKGKITSDVRIVASLPNIQYAIKQNACIILTSHLGRPTAGQYEEKYSLAPVAQRLSELLKQPVRLVKDWLQGVTVAPGEVVMCENVRFNVGEQENDETLSKKIASLCDVYVNDAFATAHRKEATTYGVAKYAKQVCAGLLLIQEIDALEKITQNPKRPLIGIIGGSKLETKLQLFLFISQLVDELIVGGGMANTFLAALGHPVGKSLYEPNFMEDAKKILKLAKEKNKKILLPTDVVVANEMSETATTFIKPVTDVGATDMILDIGPKTAHQFSLAIQKAKTILWNGPVGVFEMKPFEKGTQAIGEAVVANRSAYSLAGGGDTIAAIEKYKLQNKISYISTGGGAFLAYLEEGTLPAIEALKSIKK